MTIDELIEDIALEVEARDASDAELAVTQQVLEVERNGNDIPY